MARWKDRGRWKKRFSRFRGGASRVYKKFMGLGYKKWMIIFFGLFIILFVVVSKIAKANNVKTIELIKGTLKPSKGK